MVREREKKYIALKFIDFFQFEFEMNELYKKNYLMVKAALEFGHPPDSKFAYNIVSSPSSYNRKF